MDEDGDASCGSNLIVEDHGSYSTGSALSFQILLTWWTELETANPFLLGNGKCCLHVSITWKTDPLPQLLAHSFPVGFLSTPACTLSSPWEDVKHLWKLSVHIGKQLRKKRQPERSRLEAENSGACFLLSFPQPAGCPKEFKPFVNPQHGKPSLAFGTRLHILKLCP